MFIGYQTVGQGFAALNLNYFGSIEGVPKVQIWDILICVPLSKCSNGDFYRISPSQTLQKQQYSQSYIKAQRNNWCDQILKWKDFESKIQKNCHDEIQSENQIVTTLVSV